MTTKRTYECNLCHGALDPRSPPTRGLLEGQGVVFGSSVGEQPPFRFVNVTDAENHICAACIQGIRRLG